MDGATHIELRDHIDLTETTPMGNDENPVYVVDEVPHIESIRVRVAPRALTHTSSGLKLIFRDACHIYTGSSIDDHNGQSVQSQDDSTLHQKHAVVSTWSCCCYVVSIACGYSRA